MDHIERHRSIEAPATLVWDVMTDPDVYAAVAPNLAHVEIVSGSREGMVRRCVDTDGNAWTETCRRWDEGRGFEVVVDVADSDFHRRLFTHFEGRWSLVERSADVLVAIAFGYDTRFGPIGTVVSAYLRYRARPLIEAVFDGWEAEIESRRAESAGERTTESEPEGVRTNELFR